jgi:hypothetical protein
MNEKLPTRNNWRWSYLLFVIEFGQGCEKKAKRAFRSSMKTFDYIILASRGVAFQASARF